MDLQVQKLTAKGHATRQRIIEGAAAEIRDRGVAVATLDDIRARTQTSKSQLFHYSPDGKEQLLLAVAEHEAQMVLDDQQPHLGEDNPMRQMLQEELSSATELYGELSLAEQLYTYLMDWLMALHIVSVRGAWTDDLDLGDPLPIH